MPVNSYNIMYQHLNIMAKFDMSRDIVQTNQYHFTVEAETLEEANKKLDNYLEGNIPSPFQKDDTGDINCFDAMYSM